MKRARLFARRNLKEMLRDKLGCFFFLGFPLALLLMFYIIDKNIPTDVAEVTRKPEMEVNLTDPKVAAQVLRLVDRMEELDDVQNVYHNWEA